MPGIYPSKANQKISDKNLPKMKGLYPEELKKINTTGSFFDLPANPAQILLFKAGLALLSSCESQICSHNFDFFNFPQLRSLLFGGKC